MRSTARWVLPVLVGPRTATRRERGESFMGANVEDREPGRKPGGGVGMVTRWPEDRTCSRRATAPRLGPTHGGNEGGASLCTMAKSRERTSSCSIRASSRFSPAMCGSSGCGPARAGAKGRPGSPPGAISSGPTSPTTACCAMTRPSGEVSVFREPSNNSNGNTVDNQGRLVTCEHLTRRVTRTEVDGSIIRPRRSRGRASGSIRPTTSW